VTTHPAPPALRARGLGFTYRNAPRPALQGVDVELDADAWALLLGPTGAGKSTLARAANRTIPHFFPGRLEGILEVAGHDTSAMTVPAMARLAGVVFQDFEAQIFSTSCLLEVAFAMESRCMHADTIRRRAADLLARVGLAGYEARDPTTLSGGEKQRLVIAAVLALEAPLLVLDEPASDLDPSGRQAIYSLIASLRPGAVLLVEHDLEGVPPASLGILLQRGTVTAHWSGTPEMLARAAELEASGVRAPPMATLASALRARRGPQVPQDLPADPEGFAARLRAAEWGLSAAGLTGRGRRPALGEEVLRCDRVTHTYGRGAPAVRALHDVSLSIRAGERVVIIGANGSGKTTLARHMAGLMRPDAGRVLWQGRDVRVMEARERARAIGFVFQNPDHQIFASTVGEEVAFGPLHLGLAGDALGDRCARALSTVGLEGLEDADPFALTKGERQRLAVASVLACEPSLLILDEPTTGLDLRQQRALAVMLDSLQRQGHALVLITHALWLIDDGVDRLVIMDRGRVLAEGPPSLVADARVMAMAGLRVPDLARLGAAWGAPLMGPDDWVAALAPPGGAA